MQSVTSFVASNLNYLRVLPLSDEDVSTIKLMAFFRLFDLPLLLIVALFPLAVFVVTGSPLKATFAFAGVITSEIYSLAMVFWLAKAFYSRIAHSTGWKGLLRILYIVAWCTPTFAFYFFMKFAVDAYEISSAYSSAVVSRYDLLSFVFPFCFGFLMDGFVSPRLLVTSAFYVLLAAFALRWLLSSVYDVSVRVVSRKVTDVKVRVYRPILGMLRKDVRLISRTPSYAMLVMLPIAEGLVISSSFGSVGLTLLILSLMVILSFVVFAIEVRSTREFFPWM